MPRFNRHWLALAGAIAIEVAAAIAMKQAALAGAAAGQAFTLAGVAVSWLLLGLAVQRIPLALAYAVWEVAGLVLVVAAGAALFGEALTPARVAGFVGLLAGAFLLERGMRAAGAAP